MAMVTTEWLLIYTEKAREKREKKREREREI